ncbi:MAG: helix-turn-helix domain-containing protein [Tannerella sp.]|jgi:AraC-like DNA-binding protein|nr:helix-turn-helix domain-containing protein [Tannerella sp.]
MDTVYQKKRFDDLYVSILKPDAPDVASGNDFIDLFARLLRRHRHRTIGFYAKLMGLPSDMFCITVKTLTGELAIDCICRYVDRSACELLRKTTLPLGDVAKKLGFSSLSAFSQFFMRMHKCSPRDWRWTESGKQ